MSKSKKGFSQFSYFDFVSLASVLAYAIAEELDDVDLEYFLIFLGQLQSDLAFLRLDRGVKKASENLDISTSLSAGVNTRKKSCRKK